MRNPAAVTHAVNPQNCAVNIEEARQILCKYGIDPYCGCENLAITQNRCHSETYASKVLRDLKAVDEGPNPSQEKIVTVLEQLAIWHSNCGDGGEVLEDIDE